MNVYKKLFLQLEKAEAKYLIVGGASRPKDKLDIEALLKLKEL